MRISAGFTLIEMLVVFSLLFVFSAAGMASYVQFNNNQSLDVSSSEFSAKLSNARMQAVSQVVPAEVTGCAGQSLQGYQIRLTPWGRDYETDILCGGQVIRLNQHKLLNNTCFDSTSSTPVVFNAVDGTTKPGTVTINGAGKSRVISIDNAGNVSVREIASSLDCSSPPPLTPTIPNTPVPPTNIPTPTPTLTPTPTASVPTNTPVPPTNIPTPTPTLTPTPTAVPRPALVQKNFVTDNGQVTLPASVTAGNLILVAVTQFASTITSVTDNRGNTYVLVGVRQALPPNDYVSLYYARNVVAGSTTVTVRFSAADSTNVGVYEFSGLSKTMPLDRVVTQFGGSTTPNGGILVGTQNNQLYFAVGADDYGSGTPLAGNGYTLLDYQVDSSTHERFYSEYRVSPLGSYATNFNIGAYSWWAVVGASFK